MTKTKKPGSKTNVKPDHATKIFMDQPEIFADAVNYAVYKGKQVVDPQTLMSDPTVATSFVYNGEDAKISFEKIRDIRKTVRLDPDNRAAYMIYGIENQTGIHYAMPVKNMLYDAMEYSGQIEFRGKTFRKNKDGEYDKLPSDEKKPDREEFLSSWKKEDKLVPVVTIVVNFGNKKWDAPTSLHEMFGTDSPERNEAIKSVIPDYRILLIDPHQMNEEDYNAMKTELGTVMRFISNAKNKEKLKTMDPNKTLSKESVEVINACTGANIKTPKKGTMITVSDGIRELMEEGRTAGIATGKAEERNNMIEAMKASGASEEFIKSVLDKLPKQ